MQRQIALAIVGLVVGVGLTLIWLAPRVQQDDLPGEVASATRPLIIPFSRPLQPTNLTPWITIEPPAAGDWQTQGQDLVFTPEVPLIYGQTYTITIHAGLPGAAALPVLFTSTWQFRVAHPLSVFLQADTTGRINLWQLQPETDAPPVRLTDEPRGVGDYDAAAGSPYLLVNSEDTDGSLDLITYHLETGERRLILDCVGLCENARWQPWGHLLVYEMRPLAGGASEIWLLNTNNGQTWLAHPTTTFTQLGLTISTGQFPRWSADGRYLAYFANEAQIIIVLELDEHGQLIAEPIFIPATLDTMGQWSPVAPLFAYTEYARGDSRPHTHTLADGTTVTHTGAELYRHTVIANLVRSEAIDVVQGTEYNDGLAAWFPDGSQLAVPRSVTGEGAQIWLMAVDGSLNELLTDEPLVVHSSLVWCPCGRELLYQRSPIDGSIPPAIWLYDTTTQTHHLLQEQAFRPGWLP